MENGLLVKPEEGSPQGVLLSPLLANVYLNEYDQEMARRGEGKGPQALGIPQRQVWAVSNCRKAC